MKFRVERDLFADAVGGVAKALPLRPQLPVLAGVMLGVEGHRLTVSGFDYEVSNETTVDVQADTAGRVLVSGRLLAEITRSLPNHPVAVELDGPRLTVCCGTARFTLPTMPAEDYPGLPKMPQVAGTVDAAEFAAAVAQVATAAGRDDTLPVLTGVEVTAKDGALSLAATDRYRLAIGDCPITLTDPAAELRLLVPAQVLTQAARTMAGGKTVAVSVGQGTAATSGGYRETATLLGFTGAGRNTTTRLLEGDFPKVTSLIPTSHNARAKVPTAALTEVVKRVALVADKSTPVRLTFDDGSLTVEAGGSEDARASETLDVEFEGNPITVAFNPAFLLDGLSAIASDTAVLSFVAATKPVVLTGDGDKPFLYLLMPIRIQS